ncbi:FMN-binding negative transcriptional regulator [Rhodoferax sp.]|uniref:FMN-binding negative transcriptional regulator n=1 Tax=Rhodoferax sp. TaxID=50421 RepID=UPI0025CCF62C|nr:FMN-binding negative transcriptional regulator [Rhodoferax sp.]
MTYLPKHFEETDPATLHALVRAHPLSTWVVPQTDGELLVNHIPFLLDADRGPHGTLVGHVARANPVWRALTAAATVVVFQGPEAYISPSWYPGKPVHGKVVPTWNYAVVHAHGTARVFDDRTQLLALVTRLTALHEAPQAQPWQVADAPADYIDTMLGAIVGIEIPVQRWVGKWKVSQNRTLEDRLGVVAGLQTRGMAETDAMAALVQSAANSQ